MGLNRIGCAAALAGLASLTARAQAQDKPIALVPDSIVIDGRLDEIFWRDLDTLQLARNNDPAGGAPRAATRVLAAWNPTHFYAAFLAESRNVKGTYTRHDDPLYNQDVLELFLDPGGDGADYLEFEWNCLN